MEFPDALAAHAPSGFSLARFSLAGGFAVAVLVASMLHAPADPLNHLGPFDLVRIDKWIHLGSYALLAFLGAFVVLRRSVAILGAIVFATVAFGAGVELIQGPIPWRTMEFADVVANTVGAVGGAAVWWLLWTALPIGRPGTPDASG